MLKAGGHLQNLPKSKISKRKEPSLSLSFTTLFPSKKNDGSTEMIFRLPTAIFNTPYILNFLLRNHCVKADVLRSSAKPPKSEIAKLCLKKSGSTLDENVQPFWLNPILNILIVTRGIIHVYTITARMLCRCNASAAKNFQAVHPGAILILWCAGIIMQKKAKKRNHEFYG